MRARFAPRVPCAIEPSAFGLFFDLPPPPIVETRGDIAIVSVRGCLMHHEDGFFDSYDAIKSRVLSCLGRGPDEKISAIVLSIDSPGGLVSGAFDTADEIRARCAEAGVPLYSYVDGQAASAAFALACAGSRIVIPPTGMVGSIGCIAELVDVSKMNAAMGVSVALITSGKRKADGNPSVPLDDAAANAIRGQVMQLAELFFEHVALARPMQVDEVRALEAGIVIGASAVPMLADDVMGLDEMIAAIAAGTFGQVAALASAESGDGDMAIKTGASAGVGASKAEDDEAYESTISTLRGLAAKGNAKAKKMLQAEMADDEPDGDEQKKKDEEAAAAAAPAAAVPPPAPEKKDDDAKAIASQALATAQRAERDGVLASRPDLSPELRASLADAPIATVRSVLAATPVKPAPKLGSAAASAVVSATRGDSQTGDGTGGERSHGAGSSTSSIAQAMGIKTQAVEPRFQNGVESFPAMTRAEGVAWLAKRDAEAKAKSAAAG